MWENKLSCHSSEPVMPSVLETDTRALEDSSFRSHRRVRLAQTSHLLTPFVDDAEGRSHDAAMLTGT